MHETHNKAKGTDNTVKQALVFGGNQLCVHSCVLFNLFIKLNIFQLKK